MAGPGTGIIVAVDPRFLSGKVLKDTKKGVILVFASGATCMKYYVSIYILLPHKRRVGKHVMQHNCITALLEPL